MQVGEDGERRAGDVFEEQNRTPAALFFQLGHEARDLVPGVHRLADDLEVGGAVAFDEVQKAPQILGHGPSPLGGGSGPMVHDPPRGYTRDRAARAR